VFAFPNGAEIAVCGSVTPEASMPGAYLIKIGEHSDFSFVVSKDMKGTTQLGFISGGWGGGPTLIMPMNDATASYIEAIQDKSNYYSLFTTQISCAQGPCVVGKKMCANNIPKNVYRDVVDRVKGEKIKRFRDVPESKRNGEFYLDLVTGYSHELLMRGLVGDKQAATVLLNSPFELDAAPGELWNADVETYREAEKLGCIER
jgi:hypothetical protein